MAIKLKSQMKLKQVNSTDSKFLYELLKQREPKQNISHRKMPTYLQHVKFVKSKPYKFWYVLIIDDEKIGSVYLTTLDEVGISLIKEYKGLEENIFKLIMKRHPRKRYFINISPKNVRLELLVKKWGFKMIQKTYEYGNDDK